MAGRKADEIECHCVWDPQQNAHKEAIAILRDKKKTLEFSPNSEIGRVLDPAFGNMNSSFSDMVHFLSDLNQFSMVSPED